MTERREIKQRPSHVWERVRADYLAGEPAKSVARRHDVGLGNLRYRANSEGWTRKAAMASGELDFGPPPEGEGREGVAPRPVVRPASGAAMGRAAAPGVWDGYAPGDIPILSAMQTAAEQAAWFLANGRPTEANATVTAMRNLAKLVGLDDPNHPRGKVFANMLLELGMPERE